MKTTLLIAVIAVGRFVWPEMGWAQGALRTDPTGNPVSSLSLGGTNVTGTLAVERLPTAARPPIVQTISQTQGNVTLGAGTNVAVLGGTLTGELHLTLPGAASYPAGRALVVVDPGGYSSESSFVTVLPAGSDKLNGGTEALTVLAGTGSVNLSPDGATRWAMGQSYLNVPSSRGLVIATPGHTMDDRMLSVRNATGRDVFSVENNHTVRAVDLLVEEQFSSDLGNIYTNGEGIFNTTVSVNAPTVYTNLVQFLEPKEVSGVAVYEGQAALFFGTDGRLHCVTEGGEDHVVSWSTP